MVMQCDTHNGFICNTDLQINKGASKQDSAGWLAG
jgi:hypothetical protein